MNKFNSMNNVRNNFGKQKPPVVEPKMNGESETILPTPQFCRHWKALTETLD